MSKLAHSNQETMDEIELDHLIESGDIDIIADKFFGMHKDSAVEKLIIALRLKRGTMLRYQEVRAVCRVLASQ